MRFAFVAFVFFGLGEAGRTPQTPAPEARLLFIGNSLTLANNLPDLVRSLAHAAGKTARCEVVAFGNFSLEDHWQQGDARKAIAKGGWSVVVLQQGPSALPESQVLLREFTARFDAEIRRAGARTALYMVWPSRDRLGDFDGVSRSYTNAAADVGGLLLPAGDAWRAAWRRDATLALYGPDGLHPTPMGSYLAALVIVQKVFGVSPIGLPAPGVAADIAKLVQESAAEANARSRLIAGLSPRSERTSAVFNSAQTEPKTCLISCLWARILPSFPPPPVRARRRCRAPSARVHRRNPSSPCGGTQLMPTSGIAARNAGTCSPEARPGSRSAA